MLKALLETCPWIRQAMLLGEQGAARVATDDDAVTPAFAAQQKRAFETLGTRFALGPLKSAVSADHQLALSFHATTSSSSSSPAATLVIVSPPRESETLGQHLADLDARAASLR